VEEQRVNIIADFTEPPDSLGDSYRLEARIVIWAADNVLKIPSSALFRRGSTWNVFVVDGRQAHLREIELGHRSAGEVEILRGLNEGEAVILHPGDQIHEGVRVKPF
jgi:HlyD family secretion protein